ncbi:MAG: ATP-binding protein [Nanoarchaeota archaeon]|nr:ATP-binding protein [Nanoarchaeota archaeon]
MIEWYEELGMDVDPFEKNILTIGNEEVLKEVFYSIFAGNMLFIEGCSGSGKTNLLRGAVKKFGGRKKVIYVNCKNVNNGLNIERVLKNGNGFLGRLFNTKPKNMILLLDEVQHLSEKNSERIKYYFDSNYLRSVIFTAKSFDKTGLNKIIMQRISKVIKLKPLTDYEAVKVLRSMVGDDLLSDRAIKKIYKHSDKNIGVLIDNSKMILKEMASQKKQKITDEELEKILEGLK